MKDLCNTTKKLSGKFSRSEKPVKDKEGRTIQGEEGQMNRWKEHFEELLNRPAPQDPPDVQPADGDLPINCDEPTKDEILKLMKQLKSGRAADPDGIYTSRGTEGRHENHGQGAQTPLQENLARRTSTN
jgi:hypothetical protein